MLEHPGPDLGRLEHQVAGIHHERLALVLVNDPDPAGANVDHLEADTVEMDPVGNRPALGNADVRSDVAAAHPARDEVPIEHTRTARGGRCPSTSEHELGHQV